MLITSIYNEESHTEKVWYESSNVFYSEFIENGNNGGDLYVTFKNGSTYKYKDVLIAPNYLMFKHGGLDGSHGKALNKHIKGLYEFEKVPDKNITLLIEEKEKLLSQKENNNN